jgi:hypothetical protein
MSTRERDAVGRRREIPIIFTADSVRAILSGAKTQTRRPLVNQDRPAATRVNPQIGDHLWVKETFRRNHPSYIFRADHDEVGRRWTSPLFLPRAASRILLEVTAVREERLWKITKEDAIAEGVMSFSNLYPHAGPLEIYADVWDEINLKRAPWILDPMVRVITFRRLVPAVDSAREATAHDQKT